MDAVNITRGSGIDLFFERIVLSMPACVCTCVCVLQAPNRQAMSEDEKKMLGPVKFETKQEKGQATPESSAVVAADASNGSGSGGAPAVKVES